MASKLCYPAVLLVLFLCRLPSSEAGPQSALVTSLPGFNGTLPSKHYSGYVNIGETHERNLYYYFVVSEREPSKDPVVLWLNGGPGCSSLDGFVYEHGPFNFEAGKTRGSLPTLHLNPSSWSKVSSVIYLDSPLFVGFSYSEDPSDHTSDDKKTANDTHTFLLKWFEQYPEFQANPFYISGESYAGVYVPTLAAEVVKGIDAGLKPVINFKGYLVGNAVTDREFDGNALVPFAHGMGLISEGLFQEAYTACQGNYWHPVNGTCEDALRRVDLKIDDLNVYDILEPCYHNPAAGKVNNRIPSSFNRLGQTDRPLAVRKRMFGRAWPFRTPVREGLVPSWPQILKSNSYVPCTNDEVATTWLNDDAVKKALHAQETITWELCSDQLTFYSNAGSMLDYHKNLTARGYRALVYSGDHDMCVPFTGSEAWTRSLGYKIIVEWDPWFINDHQVAGYKQVYDHNLTFLTVMGAGHTVPEYKPKESLAFFSRWLAERSI